MLGIDPTKLAQTQAVTKNIAGVIVVDYAKKLVELRFSTTDPAAAQVLPGLMEQFSRALAQQLNTFFAIQGKIIEKGR